MVVVGFSEGMLGLRQELNAMQRWMIRENFHSIDLRLSTLVTEIFTHGNTFYLHIIYEISQLSSTLALLRYAVKC